MVTYTSVPSLVGAGKRTVLQWLGPELASQGLLKNEPWLVENTNKAVALYRNQAFHTTAVLIASWHPYALDYLQQAPVLALAISKGSGMHKQKDRQQVCKYYRPLFFANLKLRELMEKCKVAYGLRAIHSHALTVNQGPALDLLGKTFPPSTLAQLIPKTTGKQMLWLSALGIFSTRMAHNRGNASVYFDWIARNAMGIQSPDLVGTSRDIRHFVENAIAVLADFASAHGSTFNPAWGAARALEEATRWHERLATQSAEETYFAQHGLAFNAQVELGDGLPDNWQSKDGFEFLALRSGLALFEEGAAMRHCVASYSSQLVNRQAHIYSIRKDGKRAATAEFRDTTKDVRGGGALVPPYLLGRAWHLTQLKGPCNAEPTAGVKQAVAEFMKVQRRVVHKE